MKKIILLSLLAFTSPVFANGVPTWTTGSSNRTENTTQTLLAPWLLRNMGLQ